MANNWLMLNIPLAIVAFLVVVGVPLWALLHFSAEDLFGRPDRALTGPDAPAADPVQAERRVLVSAR